MEDFWGVLLPVSFTAGKSILIPSLLETLLAVSIPLGYTFGRLGNFINGELYGRVTAVSWGMIFPHANRFFNS